MSFDPFVSGPSRSATLGPTRRCSIVKKTVTTIRCRTVWLINDRPLLICIWPHSYPVHNNIGKLVNIRLVNRRIEKRQEHSITRTEITQRWLTWPNHEVSHSEYECTIDCRSVIIAQAAIPLCFIYDHLQRDYHSAVSPISSLVYPESGSTRRLTLLITVIITRLSSSKPLDPC